MKESRKETILFALERINENVKGNNGNPEEMLFYLRKLVLQIPRYLIGTLGVNPESLEFHKRRMKGLSESKSMS